MAAPLVGDGLIPQPVRLSGFQAWDGTVVIVALRTLASGLQATLYRDFQNGTIQQFGQTSGTAKDDSAFAILLDNGTVKLYVSEADDGASGTTTKVRHYEFPNIFPPKPPVTDAYARAQVIYAVNLIRAVQLQLGQAAEV